MTRSSMARGIMGRSIMTWGIHNGSWIAGVMFLQVLALPLAAQHRPADANDPRGNQLMPPRGLFAEQFARAVSDEGPLSASVLPSASELPSDSEAPQAVKGQKKGQGDTLTQNPLPKRKPIYKASAPVFLPSDPRLSITSELVITFVGDLAFTRSGQRPNAKGINRHGRVIPWDRAFAKVKPLVDGDLNFANLETAISPRWLPAVNKRFTFLGHPNGVEASKRAGFNLLSLANNHSYDHGFAGMASTLAEVSKIKGVTAAGLGKRPEVFEPAITEAKGLTVAFNAIGIMSSTFRATATKVGQPHIRSAQDIDAMIAGFNAVEADVKILSVHIGSELATVPEADTRALLLRLVEDADLDVLVAHHPHVMRPVERTPSGAVILHSLGNFLLVGAADINGRGSAVDWGGLARLYLSKSGRGDVQVSAVEMTPLKDVHFTPRPLSASQNGNRISLLNKLTQRALPRTGIQFRKGKKNIGFACLTNRHGPRAAALCDKPDS